VLIAGDQALLRGGFRVLVDRAGVRVLMLVACGLSNAETAANVQISAKTDAGTCSRRSTPVTSLVIVGYESGLVPAVAKAPG
jgi:hypothetical protein